MPENRRARRSCTIELAALRVRSTAASPGDPIVYLAGGPGASGTEAMRGTRWPAFQALRAAGDVIALDQRGTGRSRPNLHCPGTADPAPLDQPLTRDGWVRRVRRDARACASHWRRRGADLSGYNAEEIADDLESLRLALGASRLVLWGVSYGTHLALATLRRHPDLASRAILAGVVGPDDSWRLASAIDRQLDQAARVAGEDPPAPAAPVAELLRTVVARLDADPVRVTVPPGPAEAAGGRSAGARSIVVSGYDLLSWVNSFLVDPARLAQAPAAIRSAAAGDLEAAARYLLQFRVPRSLGPAMGFAVRCASGVSLARRRRLAEEDSTSVFGPFVNVTQEACDVWGVRDLGEAFRQPVRSDVPVLIVSGTRDLTTPLADAVAVLAGLSRGEHLVLEGAGHGDPLVTDPAVIRRMVAFLGAR